MDRDSEQRLAIKRDFASFLDAEGAGGDGASAAAAGGIYAAKIGALLSVPGGVPARGARLDVDLQDLAGAAPDLHARLMEDPADCIPAFEEVSSLAVREGLKDKEGEGQRGRCGLTVRGIADGTRVVERENEARLPFFLPPLFFSPHLPPPPLLFLDTPRSLPPSLSGPRRDRPLPPPQGSLGPPRGPPPPGLRRPLRLGARQPARPDLGPPGEARRRRGHRDQGVAGQAQARALGALLRGDRGDDLARVPRRGVARR